MPAARDLKGARGDAKQKRPGAKAGSMGPKKGLNRHCYENHLTYHEIKFEVAPARTTRALGATRQVRGGMRPLKGVAPALAKHFLRYRLCLLCPCLKMDGSDDVPIVVPCALPPKLRDRPDCKGNRGLATLGRFGEWGHNPRLCSLSSFSEFFLSCSRCLGSKGTCSLSGSILKVSE